MGNFPEDHIYQYDPAPGVKLLVDKIPLAKGAAVGFWFPFGSAHEKDNERGLSHFTEHMLFKGSGERDAREFSRTFDRFGGYINAFTERETICFHGLVPVKHVDTAVSMIMDMIYRPKLGKADFEKEKNVIINEILSSEDDIEESAQDEFLALVYKGHPASRKIAGRLADIKNASHAALGEFHDKKIRQGSLVITMAGNLDPDRMAEQVSAYIQKIDKRHHYAIKDKFFPVFNKERKMIKASGSQVYFFYASALSAKLEQDEFWQLSIANSAYGESMSSRLFMHLREEEGLCYNIGSSLYLSPYIALWAVSSATTQRQFPVFANAYLEEAQSFFAGGLTREELAEAVSRIEGSILLASDDPEFRMKRLARQFIYEGSCEPISVTRDRIVAVKDPDRINALVKNNLDPEKASLLLYGKLGTRTAKTGRDVFGAEEGEASES